MSDTFLVTYSTLMGASAIWDDQAEELRGGHKRLTDAKNAVDDLGDRAGPAASAYLATWLQQVRVLAAASQSRADGLVSFTRSTVYYDHEAAAEIRALLPWPDRNVEGPLAFGVPPFLPGTRP